ncbi:MAG: hypothetical protein HZB43_08425 [candidate division Zixibacteria bacterium]|nr:hypothetical protein [candidate division Zixibacteria bacterium]
MKQASSLGARGRAIGVHGSVYNSWFVVGDVETGQTLFEYRINYPHGEITITGDGTLAAFTDPGTASFGEVGIPYVVDLGTYRVTKAPYYPDPMPIRGSQVRFLPGDHRIVLAPAIVSVGDTGPVQVIDAATMTLQKTIWPIPADSLTGEWVSALGIGPRP